jgi:serine/threonine protein kinase
MVACQYCGTQNRSDARFCNSCGGLLPGAQPPASTSPSPNGYATQHATGRLQPQSRIAGRYLILQKVGEGGMAAVYQATDTRTNRTVALKEMSQAGLSPEDIRDALASFRFEADTLSRLRHPNLPQVYDRFSEGTRHYLVMDFIDGQTLEQRLNAAGGSGLPEVEVLGWAKQLCSVLTYLHNQQPPIIFRDLKPGNIMLTRGGQIKLIDFGIARVFAPGRARDTQVLGTPGFAPPEQYGKAQTDPRADIYALGCTLYQLLTGYDPATTPFALPPMSSRNPHISPHIQLAIERATKLDRDARYPTIAAFEQDLLHPAGLYFRSGDCARNKSELIALCQRQPQEAAEHLYDGRIEGWLRAWGETSAATSAATAARTNSDHAAGLRALLADISRKPAASQSTWRGYTSPGTRPANPTSGGTQTATQTRAQTAARTATASPAVVTVTPRSLHFGRLVSGQRGMQTFLVNGQGGASVQGQINSLAPWLIVDRTSFNGTSVLVQVAAETSKISGMGVQQANIQIVCGNQRLYLPVTVEVLLAPGARGAVNTAGQTTQGQAAKSQAQNQTTNQASTASAGPRPGAPPRSTPAKYLLGDVPRTRLSRLLTTYAVALGLALAVLNGLPIALAERHIQVKGNIWFVVLTLLVSAAVTIPGALAAGGRKGWPGRARAVLIGAVAGLLGAVLIGTVSLLSGPGQLLVPFLAGAGAALGADSAFGRTILYLARFVAQHIRFFISLAAIIAGAWGGMTLAGHSSGTLVPFGLLFGGIAGAVIASYINRLLAYVSRAYP